MPKIDAIIFDIDGTLVDVSKSYREAIRLTAGDFLGRTVSKQEVDAVKSRPGFNNDWDATFALVSKVSDPPSYQTVKNKFQEYYLGSLINREKLLVKASLLRRLAGRYALGIVTGRPRSEALYVLKRLQIISYFRSNSIICLEDTTVGKPDPSPLLLCQKRLRTKNCVYIGDSINDRLAARSANLAFRLIGKKQSVNQITKSLLK